MEEYDKLTNFETKMFTNFYNMHYAWHKFIKQEEDELILIDDKEWKFNQWDLLSGHVGASIYRMKNDLENKYDFYSFIYYRLYLKSRFMNINKKVRQMYLKKNKKYSFT